MSLEQKLFEKTGDAIRSLYSVEPAPGLIAFQKTRKEFEGDLTLVTFPIAKISKKSPDDTAQQLGAYLKDNVPEVTGFNVVKGFLNISIADSYWLGFFNHTKYNPNFGIAEKQEGEPVMVEYSSPNTNKPLHLGHIRNNLLGYSVAQILKANGKKVMMMNLVNDRGIHICKSMLAWQKWGKGETPASTGMKGDHLVGKYYVEFDKALKAEAAPLMEKIKSGDLSGFPEKIQTEIRRLLEWIEKADKKDPKKKDDYWSEIKEMVQNQTSMMKEAQEMLRKWEAGDADTIGLWKTMNGWVYEGFDKTYKVLGVSFDRFYYESETYLLGKKIVEEGLKKGVLFRKDDGSVWIDLKAEGLDEKLLLRSDGTSVYMTQDLGTAAQRVDEYNFHKMIYVVGNEQEYHFKVLQLVMKKLGYAWADGIFHLSYGMVELPSGKMKSREGTVVDADDLVDEMLQTSERMSRELGKVDMLDEGEAKEVFRMVGLAALKYFILKVDPKKKMLFNPEESIDFTGNTGPYIQSNYVRTRALVRKASEKNISINKELSFTNDLLPIERALLRLLHDYPAAVKQAGDEYSPAVIANYAYELSKEYSQYYQEVRVFEAESQDLVQFRLALSVSVGNVIGSAMKLLGIEVPERM
jgi:arginyl-tRNA synthetase